MDIDFEKILQALKQGIAAIAEKDLKEYIAAATADGTSILNGLKDDLELWTLELSGGLMNKSDFADLVMGQKDEIELVALKQAGLAKINADKFKQDMFNLLASTIMAVIP